MTKAEVILKAIERGATDAELATLEATTEDQFNNEEVGKPSGTATRANAGVVPVNTASTGEESSTDTEVKTKEKKIDNNYSVIDGVWTNSYKKPKLDNNGDQTITDDGEPEYEQVNSIIPKSEVPNKFIKEYEKSITLEENKGGALNFVFGEDDVDFMDNSVMDNYNALLPRNDETKLISDNINSQILLYNQDQAKLKELNDQVESTASASITNVGLQMLGPNGELPEGYNQQSKQKAQEQTKVRQRILEGRTETENSIKSSRVGKFLSDAEKLWPKNEPKSKMTEMSIDTGKKDKNGNPIFTSWLDKTASTLMQKSDEDNLFEKNVAAYLENKQGVGEVFDTKEQLVEKKKAQTKIKELKGLGEDNVTQMDFLGTDIKKLDTDIAKDVVKLNKIDYSGYTKAIEKYDKELEELGPEVKYGAFKWNQLAYDKYNSLINQKNEVINGYQKEEEVNKKLYNDYLIKVDARNKLYKSYENRSQLGIEYDKNGEGLVRYVNALNRNNHNITAALTWVGTSALHMASGIEGAVNAVKEFPEDLLFELYDNDASKMPGFVKMLHAVDGFSDSVRFAGKDKFNKFVADLNDGVQAPTQYEDIENVSDLGAFGMNVVANFVPQYALMYATGGASIYIMGSSAFGGKYDQMEFTNRQLFGKTDYSLAGKWVASGIAFGGEVVSEKLSYGVFKGKAKGVSDKVIDRVKYSFSKNVYETAKRVGKRTISNVPYMYQESVGEVFAEFSNNVGDKYVLGENISLGKGLKGAALSGLFMERAMSMPGLYQDASSIFAGKDYKQKITENTEKC